MTQHKELVPGHIMLIMINFEGERMRYKFRYFDGISKAGAKIACPMQNFLLTFVIIVFVYTLFGKIVTLIGIEDYIINKSLDHSMQRAAFICAFIAALAYFIFRKGVFLYDDRLVIARNTITLTNWKPRITVNYDDIEHVNVNYTDLHFTKYYFSIVTPYGDEAYNVELTLKSGKKYFFSIQDQEEFCEVLNSLIEKYKNNNTRK